MNGIVWESRTDSIDFSFFKNFYDSLKFISKDKLVKVNLENLDKNLKNIFVIDEHFSAHKEILFNKEFIKYVKTNNIKLLIFNTEKIFKNPFPISIEIYENLKNFNEYELFLSDANDVKKIGTKLITKQYLSENFKYQNQVSRKKDEIIFLGQTEGIAYKSRRKVLRKVEKYVNIPLTIQNSKRKLDYKDFLNLIGSYKFSLNPLGNGKSEFLNVRFFESLKLQTIPIQQVTKGMLSLNDELDLDFIVKFIKPSDLKNIDLSSSKYNFPTSFLNPTLESYFLKNKLQDFLKI